MDKQSSTLRRRLAFLVMLVTLVLVFMLIHRMTAPTLANGPVDVIWDRETCAHCRMHVGDPRFAAQLQTTSGEVLNFDDAGCLLQRLAVASDDVHAVYFHAQHEDAWIPAEEVRFISGQSTPMGFGLGAVRDDGQAGPIDFTAAMELARARHAEVKP